MFGIGRLGDLGVNGTLLSFSPLSLFAAGETGGWYDPSDISTLFQDTAATTPVTANNDPVGRINDKSGNGNHLLQATAGKRPLYKVSGSFSWVQLDGTDDFMQKAFTLNQPNMRVTGIRMLGWTNGRYIFDGGSDNASVLFQTGSTPNIEMYSGAFGPASTDAAVNADVTVTETFNGASSKLSINGGTDATGDAGTQAAAGFALGTATAGTCSNYRFYGGVAIGRILTASELASMHTYLTAKMGG